ncbi:MAG TPA: CheB methylesterase domain-containing protein, partial [Kofleriaceae bacterium]
VQPFISVVPWLPLASGDPVVVGIAASAGGPSALATVIGSVAADLPICLAVVQHLPRGFAPSFVSFLQARCSLTVCLAEHGQLPRSATVVVAPDDHHLELVDGHFALTGGPPVEGHRPSGTVLLRSLAALGSSAIGVVLSGIGRDGADGLRAMRDRHATTIAQDAESSVVYGMPRAAVEEGAAQSVLPVGQIGDAIVAAAARARRRRRPGPPPSWPSSSSASPASRSTAAVSASRSTASSPSGSRCSGSPASRTTQRSPPTPGAWSSTG